MELMGIITLVVILYIVVEWVIPLGKKLINSFPASTRPRGPEYAESAYTTHSEL